MNMMAILNFRAMGCSDDGEPKTTSYAVAEAFGKRHSDVLRAIKNMKCSDGFAKRNFALCFENNELQNGKPRKFYKMTERGFMFLVMGLIVKRLTQSRRHLSMHLSGWPINSPKNFNTNGRDITTLLDTAKTESSK